MKEDAHTKAIPAALIQALSLYATPLTHEERKSMLESPAGPSGSAIG